MAQFYDVNFLALKTLSFLKTEDFKELTHTYINICEILEIKLAFLKHENT